MSKENETYQGDPAADLIDELQKENAKLKEAFEEINKELSIWGVGNQDDRNTVIGIQNILSEHGLLQECPDCKNMICSCYG